ncbi:MAG: peptidase, partial [bacterium]
MFDETRAFLEKLGLPAGDAFDLPTSDQRFPDGAHFRIEVPTINTAVACKALLEEAERIGVIIN